MKKSLKPERRSLVANSSLRTAPSVEDNLLTTLYQVSSLSSAPKVHLDIIVPVACQQTLPW